MNVIYIWRKVFGFDKKAICENFGFDNCY